MREWRLTLVTPTLNQSDFIEDSIRSVHQQLGPNDRHIIVDGGSTDGTQEILAGLKDERLAIHIRSGESQAQALHFGFENYPAKFAAYLNSDDLLLPDTLETALAALQEPRGPIAVYGHRLFINAENELTRTWHLPKHSSYFMRRWDYIPQETCFWRYEEMMKAGSIDTSLKFAIDYDLFIRLMERGSMQRLDRYLGAFREHSRSKTSTVNNTLGKQEVALLKRRYSIRHYPWDRALGAMLRRWVESQSKRTLRRRRRELLDLLSLAFDR